MTENSKKIDDIKYWAFVSHQGIHPSVSFRKTDFDWLIEQAEKVERYEKALTKIATKKMSMYISSSHMNQDFIKVANDALEEGLSGN